MKNKKVLVTGGAGFIGSHVVDSLVESGFDVAVIDNLVTGRKENLNKKARFYKCDIRNKNEVENVFLKEKPEIVNHHAAQISVIKSVENPSEDIEINALGMINLLECSKKHKIEKIIFASTGGAIYGEVEDADLPASELLQPKPLAPYGISKYVSELYLKFYSNNHSLPYVSLRYANVYGPRQIAEGEAGVIAIFINHLLKNTKPTIYGDGAQERDFIHVDDVTRANILAIKSKDSENKEINISTERPASVNEIFTLLKRITGYSGEAEYGNERKGEVKRIYLRNNKAKELLGWQPKITLEEGLKRTIAWYKDKKYQSKS